jgi:glycosyltransferase involved in cell wall biosynthesis
MIVDGKLIRSERQSPYRPSILPQDSLRNRSLHSPMLSDSQIAFVGTYPPRRCGIATFTRDLAAGMNVCADRIRTVAVAVTDAGGRYDYAEEVATEIRQGIQGDYRRAAEQLNSSDARLVMVQHEYGIFGGDDGAYVLDLLGALRVPAIVTLHTVLKNPSPSQRAIVQQIAKRHTVVVMSEIAAELLARRYDMPRVMVHTIPHGIPDMAPHDQDKLKAQLGVDGRRMLLTFGLLGPNKGIETVIRALPDVVARCPDLIYFIVGATHPAVLRANGEEYRTSLEREVEQLGVRDHVVFCDQYVTTNELCSYLQATDVFVSPYLNEAQVTSGALSYAMGAGAAVVSTPYWHAQELLADGRGRLFPFADSVALGRTIISLLSTPTDLKRVRTAAHEFTRAFTWPRIGAQYLSLGTEVVRAASKPVRSKEPPRASLPELRLDHLQRLTDDTGIIQHATFSVPARESGYCVDDNARALIVALHADRLSSSVETKRLVSTYLAFLHSAQTADGVFRNLMSYGRCFIPQSASDDSTGRALWALGTATLLAGDDGHRRLAREMFERGLASTEKVGPRGAALSILGLASFLTANPDVRVAASALRSLCARLVRRYRVEATTGWRWFEPTLTYDNALLPLALFRAYAITRDPASLDVAMEALEFLERTCFEDDRLVLIGNAGWYSRAGSRAVADEQPIDAAAFVLAYRGAYRMTGDPRHLRRMRQSFAWFLGANRLGIAAYDPLTAGCRDGLGATEPNLNQGAESTICFLLSLIEMSELEDERLESGAGSPAAAASA